MINTKNRPIWFLRVGQAGIVGDDRRGARVASALQARPRLE
jgi:hypothetical protein